jgi:hypothetical protein
MQDVSQIIVEANPEHLINGIIITDQGQYPGICTGPDLMREITQLQITAARYANPLTQLPGNVPINEHIDQLLQKERGSAPVIAISIISNRSTMCTVIVAVMTSFR